MKKVTLAVLASLLILILASCATTGEELRPEVAPEETDVSIAPEPAPQPQPEPQPAPEPEPQPVEEPAWTIGETGPYGGMVFICEGRALEASEAIYDTPSYDEAVKMCEDLSVQKGVVFRLPSLDELKALYEQLVVTELLDVDWTYYWSCEEAGEDAVMILNFDMGFEGRFYKDNDFVSAIPVTEL